MLAFGVNGKCAILPGRAVAALFRTDHSLRLTPTELYRSPIDAVRTILSPAVRLECASVCTVRPSVKHAHVSALHSWAPRFMARSAGAQSNYSLWLCPSWTRAPSWQIESHQI